MSKIRIRYSKTGRSKYISHLDLSATLQRAFLRAGVKLKYSEGFNPHPYISVALPLSVGFESICELVDVAMLGESLPDKDIIKLPEGIEINEIYLPTRKFNDIKWLEVNGKLNYDKQMNEELAKDIKSILSKDSIVISKRTKRGTKDIDIAPHIKDIEVKYAECILISAKISAQEPTLNPMDLINALGEDYKPDYTDFRRVELYDSGMTKFE